MEQLHPHQGGETRRLRETPRWPRYMGALALDTWLTRVAAYDSIQVPSVELYIAQYPGEEVGPAAVETLSAEAIQLPLHLQWATRPYRPICAKGRSR